MSHCDGVFLLNVRNERALVVYDKRKHSVLIWDPEGGGKDGRCWGAGGGEQRDAVVGVQHGEVELEGVGGWDGKGGPGGGEGGPVRGFPFGEFNLKCLRVVRVMLF